MPAKHLIAPSQTSPLHAPLAPCKPLKRPPGRPPGNRHASLPHVTPTSRQMLTEIATKLRLNNVSALEHLIKIAHRNLYPQP